MPTIDQFDFGTSSPLVIPDLLPSPVQYLEYTAWHLRRALQCIEEGGNQTTTPLILNAFQDKKVIRAIQPHQRVYKGVLEMITIKRPEKPFQQAAILLYCLLDGSEGKKCAQCKALGSVGPFAQCIPRGDAWTGGACLNCLFTGTAHRCQFRKERDLQKVEALKVKQGVPIEFPPGAEKMAHPDDLIVWRDVIRQELQARFARAERRARGTSMDLDD